MENLMQPSIETEDLSDKHSSDELPKDESTLENSKLATHFNECEHKYILEEPSLMPNYFSQERTQSI